MLNFNNLPIDLENSNQNGCEGMENYNLQHINRLEIPITLKPNMATFEDIAIHMIYRQRLSQSYTERLLHYAGNMATHKIPINFQKPDYINFIQHMDYREQIENTSPAMLKLEWVIMQHFLTAYGIPYANGTQWNYKPPSIPPPQPRYIPLPDELYKITHYKYTTDKIKNACIHYPLLHSAIFGWRNPSELCILKTTDIELENGIITITEKKKHNKKRQLIVDYPQVIDSKQIKSLKNWIDIWRPRIATQHSKNHMYLRYTDGQPLGETQYTRFINYYVNPIFPKFQLYSTRHFNATGMLIREYINTGHWNKHKVKNWLGHERETTTDSYVRYAELYMKKAKYDWFKRVLKNHNKMVEENSLKSTKPQKTFVSDGNSPKRSELSERKQTVFK